MQNFNELAISELVMKAILELGYETPSPIQAQALPLLLGQNTDFLGLAATGTGKTAAFGIPLLERIEKKTKGVQGLILCPTRELAIQVAGQIDLLGKFLGIKSLPIYGGTGYGDQIYGLKAGATIVVGTPGRVVDHLDKGTLKLDNLKTLILDEADEMISMGFKEDLEKVLQAAPKDQANIWLFSATMGPDVRDVADQYLKNPQKVQVNRTEMLPDTVQQLYYMTHEYDKPELLCKLIEAADDFYGIVFCQTKALVADVNQFLQARGYRVDCLHGDLDQTNRDRVMKAFRDKKISILIATDVACRGLDVKDITHVINYSIPRELDNYVHRIGRTGRSGKSGVAMSFVTRTHRELIGRIERMTKSRMTEGTIPSGKEIAMKKVSKALAEFEAQEAPEKFLALFDDAWKASLEKLTKEEIAGRFLLLVHPEIAPGKEPARLADSRSEQSKAPRGEGRGGDRGGRRDSGRGEGRYAPREGRDERPRERAPRRDFSNDSGAPASLPKPRAEGEAGPAPRREREDRAPREKSSWGAPKPRRDREERAPREQSSWGAPKPRRDREDRAPRAERVELRVENDSIEVKPKAPGKFRPKFSGKPEKSFGIKKFDEKRTPPWERKPSGSDAPRPERKYVSGGTKPFKPFKRPDKARSKPWG